MSKHAQERLTTEPARRMNVGWQLWSIWPTDFLIQNEGPRTMSRDNLSQVYSNQVNKLIESSDNYCDVA